MNHKLIALLVLALTLSSCDNIKNSTKKTINKGGEVVGNTTTQFFEGVTEGVDRALECELQLSPQLQSFGIKTGKFVVDNSKNGGKNNLLTLYIIFEDDFKKTLSVKAFDKKDLEIGRTSLEVSGKAGEAGYFDFEFDKRTYIEVRSKISIE
ncbi:MAG: hypothetical protein BM564_01665 [Bacteroidetes bacterium MedPE-SWsnd-G2]|nr:MAG: hypothetical protein BM564_01665 [Bacteroidetes bacterium MedPE-SWsnd-G2]